MASPDDEMPEEKTRERNLAVVKEVFARISAGDFDGMVELMADDLEFDLAYAPEFIEMPVRGKKAFHALQAGTFPMFSSFKIEVVEHYPMLDPDGLVAEYRSDAVVAANGKPYRNRYIGVMRLRDGKVAFWREFHNPEATAVLR